MSWFSDLFGKPKKPQTLNKADYRIPQITDYPTGKTVEQWILDALREGKDIGYPEDYVNRSTSPLVATREARWGEEELPFLRAQAGATGMSRSTLTNRDIGKSFASKERDINDIIAQAYSANEAQKKSDIARYQNLGYDFAGTQQGIGERQINQDLGIDTGNLNLNNAYNQQKSQWLPGLVGQGISAASSLYSMGQSNRLLDLLSNKTAGAAANVSTLDTSPFTTRDMFKGYRKYA